MDLWSESPAVTVSLLTKIAVIDAVESGTKSKADIAKSFSIPKSTHELGATILVHVT